MFSREVIGYQSADGKVTILPPQNTGYFARRRVEKDTRMMEALVPYTQAETELMNAQTALLEADLKEYEAECRLNEAPEREAHALAVRREKRAEEVRQTQHEHDVNAVRRAAEMVKERTALARQIVALIDAEQQIQAQRDHGYLTYEIVHRKRQIDMLDLELGQAERRKILEGQTTTEGRALEDHSLDNAARIEIEQALLARRSELLASGLDTGQLDAIIREWKAR